MATQIFVYFHPDPWGNDPTWLHPRKLTWNLKIPLQKRRNIYQVTNHQCLGFHVSFPGCNIFQMGWQKKHQPETGSTIRTLLHGKINPKNWQVLSLDVGLLLFFRVVSGDYGKPRENTAGQWCGSHVPLHGLWRNTSVRTDRHPFRFF